LEKKPAIPSLEKEKEKDLLREEEAIKLEEQIFELQRQEKLIKNKKANEAELSFAEQKKNNSKKKKKD